MKVTPTMDLAQLCEVAGQSNQIIDPDKLRSLLNQVLAAAKRKDPGFAKQLQNTETIPSADFFALVELSLRGKTFDLIGCAERK